MLHGTKTESEIPGELHIQICKLWRLLLRINSGQSLASFRRAEQERAAKLLRLGQLPVPQVRPGSTGKPCEGSKPGNVYCLTPAICRKGLTHLSKKRRDPKRCSGV